MRFLDHLKMLNKKYKVPQSITNTVIIEKSKWIRAQKSGLLHLKVRCNKKVEKGEILATITDPYGKMLFNVLAPNDGFILNVNQAPIVHQGDAIFYISTKNKFIEIHE